MERPQRAVVMRCSRARGGGCAKVIGILSRLRGFRAALALAVLLGGMAAPRPLAPRDGSTARAETQLAVVVGRSDAGAVPDGRRAASAPAILPAPPQAPLLAVGRLPEIGVSLPRPAGIKALVRSRGPPSID
jgi:hypothetical protein